MWVYITRTLARFGWYHVDYVNTLHGLYESHIEELESRLDYVSKDLDETYKTLAAYEDRCSMDGDWNVDEGLESDEEESE